MVGIYKITSPTGRVYIGQSRNIKRRWSFYKRIEESLKQRKLYNSFKKYGIENHKFELIHELPSDISQEILDTYEQIYLDQYRYVGKDLMNLRQAGHWGKHTEESRRYMSMVQSKICKERGAWNKGLTGFKLSEESIQKRTQTRKELGYKHSEATKEKMRQKKILNPITPEQRKKMVEARINSYLSMKYVNGTSKLTIDDIRNIRLLKSEGIKTKEIAKKYGVGRHAISNIIKYRTWKHVV